MTRPHWLLSYLVLWYAASIYTWHAQAVLVNRTIDDTIGDSVTGARPKYLPTTPGIWEDATCAGCRVKADRDLAFKGTWTSSTFRPETGGSGPISIEMNFTGTAIYVFFILANNVAPEITTETACNFTLDGVPAGSFEHLPSSSTEFQYNATAYRGLGLPNKDHNLIISTSGLDRHVFVSFDYAIYTVDEPDPTTSVPPSATITPTNTSTNTQATQSTVTPQPAKLPVGAIAGGVIGGVIMLLALLLLSLLLCRRRKRQMLGMREEHPKHHPPPSESWSNGSTSAPFTIDGVPIQHSQGFHNMDPRAIAAPGVMPQHYAQREARVPIPAVPPVPARVHNQPLRASNIDPTLREALRKARQAEIDQQLRELLQEMKDLDRDRKVDFGGSAQSTTGGSTSSGSTREEEAEIVRMRQQMQAMQAQIVYLEAQQKSEWAQGLSDEPPPNYTPHAHSVPLRQ